MPPSTQANKSEQVPDFVRRADELSDPHLWLAKSPSELTPTERREALRILSAGASITVATEEVLGMSFGMPPSKYALVNRAALPPAQNTTARKMHDRVHYLALWNHQTLVDFQYVINERLREAGEWETFDIIPFLNALEQHFEGKDRFLMMQRFMKSNEKQMEWLTDLRQRKPILHGRLVGYLLGTRLYERSPHLSGCTCCLCTHILALRPLTSSSTSSTRRETEPPIHVTAAAAMRAMRG